MKVGVVVSSAAHVAILSWGLISLSAPTPLDVADVESITVDVIPFEDIVETVQGDQEADLRDTPAPTPAKRPEVKPEAINVGDTKVDIKTEEAPKPVEQPKETVKAATPPPPAPKPTPRPEVTPVPAPEKEEAPEPTTELAALTQPSVPVSEAQPSEDASITEEGELFAKLPQSVPVPQKRPQAPKPKSAETTSRKESKEPAKKPTATSDSKQKTKSDELAALINKEKPKASGAKKSKKQASLGTKKPATGKKLSRNELAALRSAIEGCWSVPSGLAEAENMKATVTMELQPDGTIKGKPKVTSSGGEAGPRRAFRGSVLRAVKRCAPYSLPKDKYDTWAEVVVNFDASDLF